MNFSLRDFINFNTASALFAAAANAANISQQTQLPIITPEATAHSLHSFIISHLC
jgi:hypothetical protein